MYSQELIDTLKGYPNIRDVWVTELGAWYFAEHPGIESVKVSRDEILKDDTKPSKKGKEQAPENNPK